MEMTIITGLSGAGKSVAVDALEDAGFYCIDNMPPSLIPTFVELAEQLESIERVALVTDIRTDDVYSELVDSLRALRESGLSFTLLFLDAADEVLARRFSESRRKHPLVSDSNSSTLEAIRAERARLLTVREMADFVVDTSLLSTAQLRERVLSLYLKPGEQQLLITCMSFGFKYGLPPESDIVLDVRCLPNPFYEQSLRNKTGLDADVEAYVMQSADTSGLLERFFSLIDYLLPCYTKEGKSQLVISLGCTGGKHRSVALAEKLNKHILALGYNARATHRDINRA